MQQLINVFEGIGSTLQLLVRALSFSSTLWRQRQRFIEQCYLVGYTTLPIVTILCSFIGGVLALIMVMYLVLGCLMDAMAMIILTVPIIFPVVTQMGFDPIWFGVIIVMTVTLGLICPPVGMNVFVLRSVLPDLPTGAIWRGVTPFFFISSSHSRWMRGS